MKGKERKGKERKGKKRKEGKEGKEMEKRKKEKKAYWSFCVVKSLRKPINTYLCSIYY